MVHYDELPIKDHVLISLLSQYQEPRSCEEAANHSAWIEVMNKETDALTINYTWKFGDLPVENKAITRKWVHKVKPKLDESIDRFKARLVIKGFARQYGTD